jgi:imidazolonepropionase-like amidohydrolase
VPIIFGTDLPVTPIPRQWEEFLALQDAGLSTADALKAATTNAAATLGMADTLGSLDAGKFADLIAVANDSRDDLHEPRD